MTNVSPQRAGRTSGSISGSRQARGERVCTEIWEDSLWSARRVRYESLIRIYDRATVMVDGSRLASIESILPREKEGRQRDTIKGVFRCAKRSRIAWKIPILHIGQNSRCKESRSDFVDGTYVFLTLKSWLRRTGKSQVSSANYGSIQFMWVWKNSNQRTIEEFDSLSHFGSKTFFASNDDRFFAYHRSCLFCDAL